MLVKKCRTGFTLIEMVFVVSITGILMMMVVGWIHETMRFSARMTSHQQQHRQLTRLAWNFRTDVRMSQSMSLKVGQRLVLLQTEDRKITYTISGTTIVVERTDGSLTQQERFPLAFGTQAKWDSGGLPNSIGLIVSRSPHPPGPRSDAPDEAKNESLLLDIHIFAQIQRWPVRYVIEKSEPGKP